MLACILSFSTRGGSFRCAYSGWIFGVSFFVAGILSRSSLPVRDILSTGSLREAVEDSRIPLFVYSIGKGEGVLGLCVALIPFGFVILLAWMGWARLHVDSAFVLALQSPLEVTN